MRNALAILTLLLLAGVAGEASAQQWRQCAPTHATGNIVGDINSATAGRGSILCYDFTSTTVSAVLDLIVCENVDFVFLPDMASTAQVGTVQIKMCAAPKGTAANVCPTVMVNVTLDGKPATATDAIYGAGAVWIIADPVTDPGGDLSRLIVKCNGQPHG